MSTKQRQVKVYITAPRLTSLSLSGGSDARSQNQLTADNFRIEASGGSDVFLTLRAKTLRTDASGGSDVTLTGKVKRQEMRFSGGSDYHGFALQSTTANIEASGGSDADVWVNGELVASASGGSDLHYKGTARSITSLSSSGSSAAKHVE